MNNSTSDYASELAVLKKKYKLLMRMMCGFMSLWMITVIGQFLNTAQASEKGGAKNKTTVQTQQTLQVNELVVVDKNGTPRVRIAGNHSDPVMLGKRGKRYSEFAGVMVYDEEGNERGGYGTTERSVFLAMDEVNRGSMQLGVEEKGGMHFWFSNGFGSYLGMGVVPTGPWFRLDTPGKPTVTLPNVPEGEKK